MMFVLQEFLLYIHVGLWLIGLVLFKLKSEENQLWDLQRMFQNASCHFGKNWGFQHLKKHVSNHGNSTYSFMHSDAYDLEI